MTPLVAKRSEPDTKTIVVHVRGHAVPKLVKAMDFIAFTGPAADPPEHVAYCGAPCWLKQEKEQNNEDGQTGERRRVEGKIKGLIAGNTQVAGILRAIYPIVGLFLVHGYLTRANRWIGRMFLDIGSA